MKLGILADIHEDLGHLRRALAVLQDRGADRLVVLGDVFETGPPPRCDRRAPGPRPGRSASGATTTSACAGTRTRTCGAGSAERVLDFMGRLRPRLEVEGCLFTTSSPGWTPRRSRTCGTSTGPPETPEELARSFAAVPHRGPVRRPSPPLAARDARGAAAVVRGGAGGPGGRGPVPRGRPRRLRRAVRPVRHGDQRTDPLQPQPRVLKSLPALPGHRARRTTTEGGKDDYGRGGGEIAMAKATFGAGCF